MKRARKPKEAIKGSRTWSAEEVLSKDLLGKFDEDEMAEIWFHVLYLMGMGNDACVPGSRQKHIKTAEAFVAGHVLGAIRDRNTTFLENLIACIRLARGDKDQTQFAKNFNLPTWLQEAALFAHQEITVKEGRLPTMPEIQIYIAHRRCSPTTQLGLPCSISEIETAWEKIKVETRPAILKFFKAKRLLLRPGLPGRPGKGHSVVRRFLARYGLTYRNV